jgi:SPW repeat
MSTTRWIAFLLGLWIAVSAFLGFGSQAYMWSDLVSGVVAIVAGAALIGEVAWEGWIAVLLGAWMVVAAFIPAIHAGSAVYWNNILIGAALVVLGVVPGSHAGQPHPVT